jgi:hypothetical protein
MQRLKQCLLAVLVVVALGGAVIVVQSLATRSVVAEEGPPPGDHWRNFDGHWSYWHAGDNRWYYTDGVHWYYHDGVHWVVYTFDKLFGIGFHHGDYKAPREVVVPKHSVFHR